MKKILALTLVLVMLFSLLPMSALAASTVTVEISAQSQNGFLFAPQSVTVSSDLAENYGYTDSVADGVSTLDVLVRAHEIKYGDAFTSSTASSYLVVDSSTGYASLVFGSNSGFGFAVNNMCPNDGVTNTYGTYTAYAITQAEINSGDFVEFLFYQDLTNWADNYIWFVQDGAVTDELTAVAGAAADLTVKGYCYCYYGCNYTAFSEVTSGSNVTAIAGAQLAIVDTATGALTDIDGAVTDENGAVSVTFASTGDYALTAYIPQSTISNGTTPAFMPLANVTISDYAPTVVDGQAAQTGAAAPESVDGTVSAVAYTAEVTSWFEDADVGDTLSYSVVSASDSDDNDLSGDVTLVSGTLTYTPDAAQAGETVTIKIKANDGIADSTGNVTVSITVSAMPVGTAEPVEPVISEDLSTDAVTYYQTADAAALAVTASISDYGTLTYQWYKGSSPDEVTMAIDGAVSASYTPDTTESGTTFYKAVLTNTLNEKTAVVETAVATVTVLDAPVLTLEVVTADDQDIPDDGFEYYVGDTASSFKVNASSDIEGGTWSYCWYIRYGSGYGGASGTRKEASYTPPTTKDSAYPYFCKVTYTLDGTDFVEYTEPDIVVKVMATAAVAPTISIQPVAAGYLAGATDMAALSVSASRSDGGTLSYQWYVSTDNETFTAIDGAEDSSYTPEGSEEEAVYYYYCEVTNTLDSVSGDTYTASNDSDTVTITYTSVANAGGDWDGSGTESDPYLIADLDDLTTLQTLVNTSGYSFAGMYFKLAADITLPDDWAGIGALKTGETSTRNGKNIWPFSATLDGDDHTVTIATGGLPLFYYVRNATVKNLNLYGKEIDGYALVKAYTVDYGPTGSYSSLDIPTIDIDNVTLKSGSSTKYGGFIGGFASGINTVTIRNSTIESGVTIGYTGTASYIGSFGSMYSGIIENCVSYADVYGSNYVGGIVGRKGQSMGTFIVRDCAFYGTATATGDYAGGIVGGGYNATSAPNTPCVTIQNCYCTGTVTASDYVGGILGGEPACAECWANGIGYIQNNHFTGTVTATGTNAQYIGGIIGYMKSLDRYNVISNNYYLDTCGASTGIGGVGAVDTTTTERFNRTDDPTGEDADELTQSATAAAFADGTVLAALNSGINSSGDWVQGTSYPELGGSVHMVELEVTGYDSTLTVGDALDLTALSATATYSDGTTQAVDIEDIAFTGFDNRSTGYKAVTAIYDNHSCIFEVRFKSGGSGSTETDTITVYFSLLGDCVHDSDTDGIVHALVYDNLETWITSEAFEVSEDALVIDVFAEALTKYGYSWYNNYTLNDTTSNYIDTISTPEGLKLSEFTNGAYSGWMYTLNGVHPSLGVAEQTLSSGDVIVFHYTDDYRIEEGSAKWAISSGSEVSSVITPDTTVTDGTASASVDKDDIDAILEASEEDGTTNITVVATTDETVTKSSVTLPSGSASDMADAGMSLTIEMSNGTFDIDNAALGTIAGAGSGKIEIIIEQIDTDELSDNNKAIVGDHPVFDLSITVGGTQVTDFGDGTVTVSLPYTPADGEDTDNLTVYYIDDSGSAVKMEGAYYDASSGCVIFETSHFSTFAIVCDAVDFDDVSISDWYYDAVAFAVTNGLFSGTSTTMFSPDADMTRAMLVTVLYRLEGEPTVTGGSAFDDVTDGQWYTDAVIWAGDSGIVSGYGSGLFGTNDSVTREQMAVILYNYAAYKGYDVTATSDFAAFNDADDISSWAETAMSWANGEGLITGVTDTTLDPAGGATRAQVATILMRFVQSVVR